MRHGIHFIYRNPEYSWEYAEQRHKGDDSEDNIRELWEDELEIRGEVTQFEHHEQTEFTLRFERQGQVHEITLPDMSVFEYTLASGEITRLAASHDLVAEIVPRLLDDMKLTFVYLESDWEPFSPYPGLYIHMDRVPEELKA